MGKRKKKYKKNIERESKMNLAKAKDTVVQTHESPGLIKVQFKYKVTSAEASVEWYGPKIPREEWDAMLSFFKWTNTEHHSESQVRLFVNPNLNTWKIWAFPQQARTGMSAREISGKDFDDQRAEFKDEDGWIYFGTVHHHCGMGAFQSGTDLDNEIAQDGLHITIGKLDQQQLDIHSRFCMAGSMFEPNLSWFWDIGEELFIMTPNEVHHMIARHQMTISPPKETPFPTKWKENVIELKGGPGYSGTFWYPGQSHSGGYRYADGRGEAGGEFSSASASQQVEGQGMDAVRASTMLRVHRAEEALKTLIANGWDLDDIIRELSTPELVKPNLMPEIIRISRIWSVDSEDIKKEAKWEKSKRESKIIREAIDAENQARLEASNGIAEYYGVD